MQKRFNVLLLFLSLFYSFESAGMFVSPKVSLCSGSELLHDGVVQASKSFNAVCIVFTGQGSISSPEIKIVAKEFQFTGAIECDGNCSIVTEQPFDHSMFSFSGKGTLECKVEENAFEKALEKYEQKIRNEWEKRRSRANAKRQTVQTQVDDFINKLPSVESSAQIHDLIIDFISNAQEKGIDKSHALYILKSEVGRHEQTETTMEAVFGSTIIMLGSFYFAVQALSSDKPAMVRVGAGCMFPITFLGGLIGTAIMAGNLLLKGRCAEAKPIIDALIEEVDMQSGKE